MHKARRYRVPVVQPEAFTAQGLAMTAWAYAEVFAPGDAPGAAVLLDETTAAAVARAALGVACTRRSALQDAHGSESQGTGAGSAPAPDANATRFVIRAGVLCGRPAQSAAGGAVAEPLPDVVQMAVPAVVAALNGLSYALTHPQTLRTATPGQLATFARALATVWSELNVCGRVRCRCRLRTPL